MWDAGFSPEAKSFKTLDLAQKYGGLVVRLHRGDLDGAPGRGVGARRSPGARRGSAARRADLDGGSRPGVGARRFARRSTWQRGSTCGLGRRLPARGRRSTLRQALSCARVIRIFLGQPCRTALPVGLGW